MDRLQNFISEARSKNLPEETIRKSLINAGWQETDVDTALVSGIEIPLPEESDRKTTRATGRPSLGSLEAALLHVLLWFFTAASTVAITAVASSLFGGSVSSEALAAMMAVTVITFTPYAILFIRFLRRLKKTPELIPGRVWSIITICIHSIGAMIAGITLVVSLIINTDPSVAVAAALVAVLNLIVLISYDQASFAHHNKKRRFILALHLIVLAIMLSALFVTSLMRLAPAQADTETRERLVESSEQIKEFIREEERLPNQNDLSLPDGVGYRRISDRTYELCANFELNARSGDYERSQPINDSYVSEYDFSAHDKGEQCFEFESDHEIQRQDLERIKIEASVNQL